MLVVGCSGTKSGVVGVGAGDGDDDLDDGWDDAASCGSGVVLMQVHALHLARPVLHRVPVCAQRVRQWGLLPPPRRPPRLWHEHVEPSHGQQFCPAR